MDGFMAGVGPENFVWVHDCSERMFLPQIRAHF